MATPQWASQFSLTTFILLGTVAYFAAVCTYRLFLHPLSYYPGPLVAKLTNGYAAYRSWKGDMHLDVQACHSKYGSVVRYGPNRILIDSVKGMQDIYGYGKPFKKAKSYATMVPWEGGWSTATSIDKHLHRNLRGTVTSGFSTASYKQFEFVVFKNLDIYFQKLLEGPRDADGWAEPKDVNWWNKWLALDTMSELGFGVRLGLLDNPGIRYILDMVNMHTLKLGVYEEWPDLDLMGIGNVISWLLSKTSPSVKRFNAWHHEFTEQLLKNNEKVKNGILAPIIRGPETTKAVRGHTKAQMIAEGSFVTLTGADANSTALSGVLFYLSHYPGCLKTLQKEIREKFESVESIVWGQELSSCVYLRACIDEALRMLPPASGVHWREAEQDGVMVDGHVIPAGTDAGLGLYPLFRKSEIFRSPSEFWPERWIEGSLPQVELDQAKRAFKPFSIGPRACAGTSVANMIIMVSVCRLVYSLDLRLAEGTLGEVGGGSPDGPVGRRNVKELQFENHFTFSMWKSGPFIRFKERSDRPMASCS